jgi:exonuclease SbcC
VHDDGAPFALARFSGGEADLANLCLRLAVSQVVAERAGTEGFGFLALDEIFGSQDEVRKGNILRALSSLSGRFRQILLITHIPDVKESADHVLRVEALDDGTSRISVDA